MSIEVTKAMVDMFSANIYHLSQQEGSRLHEHCRQETQEGESKFYDRIGLRKARRKEGRHSDVVYDDTPHSRRMLTTEDFYSADMVDNEDKLRTIMNLENEYAKSIGMALGREMDLEIISGALGTAYEGKKGTSAVVLPNSQKIACFDPEDTEVTGFILTIETLRKVRKSFKQKEAIMKGDKIIFACAAQQTDDLLSSTAVTSIDYNGVKTLVDGEVDTFMGFKFVETELLPFNGSVVNYNKTTGEVTTPVASTGTYAIGEGRRCIAFTAKKAILCAQGAFVNGRITEMPGKHYSHQVYGKFNFGATRLEDVQLMEVICKEV